MLFVESGPAYLVLVLINPCEDHENSPKCIYFLFQDVVSTTVTKLADQLLVGRPVKVSSM